ncbi:methyl-accepting chemotaxis protein [Alteribacter aurantiacus]|uniref:methyl-accepting chemotaxis protein n=1 Tax=Alteribacter aurantiacus TaxID=254410 RepID=UPI00068457BA|nr:methyl-accepting chemotaxis protein [Alteribacter aurantiacus]
MGLWGNLKIKHKILSVFTLIMCLFIGVFAYSFSLLFNIETQTEYSEEANMQSVLITNLGSVVRSQYIALSDSIRTGRLNEEYYQRQTDVLRSHVETLDGSFTNPEHEATFQHFLSRYAEFEEVADRISTATSGGSNRDARAITELREEIVQDLLAFSEVIMSDATEASEVVYDSISHTRLVFAISSGAALIIGFILFTITSQTITRTLKRVVVQAENISKGNVNIEPLEVKSKDEVGQLSVAINTMTNNLKGFIGEVGTMSDHVAASSEQLSASAQETSKATEQITESIQEVAAGAESQSEFSEKNEDIVSEVSMSIEEITDNVEEVNEASIDSRKKAESGKAIIEDSIQAMNRIQDITDRTSVSIQQLATKSAKIGSIVDLISGVAEQTNLLALNAAIEAARAGEHGRGFAVVADEVRKLAEQTTQSSSEIHTLITDIQTDIEASAMSMTEGFEAVSGGQSSVKEAGEAFAELDRAIEDVSAKMHSMNIAVERVSEGTEELLVAAKESASISKESAGYSQNVASAAEEQTATMEEITASSEQLSTLAGDMQQLLQSFTNGTLDLKSAQESSPSEQEVDSDEIQFDAMAEEESKAETYAEDKKVS